MEFQESFIQKSLGDFFVTRRTSPIALSKADTTKLVGDLFDINLASFWEIATLAHPDIAYFSPENNEWRIEEVRSKIILRASISPEGRFQTIIINDADKMNEQSANALLKTFEDTPKDTIFILIVRSRTLLLPTIISRIRIISTESPEIHQSSELYKTLARRLVLKEKAALREFYLIKQFEREEALVFLSELKKALFSSEQILSTDFFEIFSSAIETITNTNATPRYQLDRVIFNLFQENRM